MHAKEREHEKESENENTPDLCWGRQPVRDLLEKTPSMGLRILLSSRLPSSQAALYKTLAATAGIPVDVIEPAALERECETTATQGVAARMSPIPCRSLESLLREEKGKSASLLVLTDHIQDPHNLGAIVRTAEAAGASGVLFPKRRSALPGGISVKTSAGAILRVPMVAVGNVAACVGDLQNEGYWVTVLDMNGERSLWETPPAGRCVLVIGAEGEGVSHLVRQRSDESLRIPICGGTGSLNAGVAVALGMFHWAREWRKDFGMGS